MSPVQTESDFHVRFCFKKHKRLALTIFAVFAFFTAVSVHALLAYPDRSLGTGFYRYSTALGALIALFIACSLFRDAKCTSVKVIVVCPGGGAVLSLM